jgi:hypothetical protein
MVLFSWGVLSDVRTGLSFYMLLALASVVFHGSESLGSRDHILLSQILEYNFCGLLRFAGRRVMVEVFDLASTCMLNSSWTFLAPLVLLITLLKGSNRKHHFQQYLYFFMLVLCRGNVFNEPLPRIGSGIFAYLASLHSNSSTRCFVYFINGIIMGQTYSA